jgi:retron-type reverse transcriptase
MNELLEYHKQGYNVVVEADIKGFFDNIPHKLVMAMVTREISDGKTLSTIRKFLQAGVMEDGKFIHTTKGTPQGGVISPLLANIVLDHLDWTLNKNTYNSFGMPTILSYQVVRRSGKGARHGQELYRRRFRARVEPGENRNHEL